jgi:hypothetical protein
MVSVGYMDPGNWATDLEGGARFGYRLIWVLLMSNLMAVLLQTLSARLGPVTGRDLAQACRDSYNPFVRWVLFVLCEIAIAACDLAEVLGTAIGLQLAHRANLGRHGIPLVWAGDDHGPGRVPAAGDPALGIRKMEAFILTLVSIIGPVLHRRDLPVSKPGARVDRQRASFPGRLKRGHVIRGHRGILGRDRDAAQPLPAQRAGAEPRRWRTTGGTATGVQVQLHRLGDRAELRVLRQRRHPHRRRRDVLQPRDHRRRRSARRTSCSKGCSARSWRRPPSRSR